MPGVGATGVPEKVPLPPDPPLKFSQVGGGDDVIDQLVIDDMPSLMVGAALNDVPGQSVTGLAP